MTLHSLRFRRASALAWSSAGLVGGAFVLAVLAYPAFEFGAAVAAAAPGHALLRGLALVLAPWFALPPALFAFAVPNAFVERDALGADDGPNYRGLAAWCLLAAVPFVPLATPLASATRTAPHAVVVVVALAGYVLVGSLVWLPLTLTVTPRLARGDALDDALAGHANALAARPRAVTRASGRAWGGLALVALPWALVAAAAIYGGAPWSAVGPPSDLGALAFASLAVVCTPVGLACSRLAKTRALDDERTTRP